MSDKITYDAVKILKDRISQDPELAYFVEEERKRLMLAEKIRQARHESGLSQKEVAQRIGTTQSAVARLESGNYERLSLSTLIKVTRALNRRLSLEILPA